MNKPILRTLSALIVAVGFGSLAPSEAAASPQDSLSPADPIVLAQADIDHDDGDAANVDDGDVNNDDNGDVDNVDDGDVANFDVDDADVDNIDNGDVDNIDDGNVGDGNN